MCDTVCRVLDGRTLFAKSSDRPWSEVQLLEALPARTAPTVSTGSLSGMARVSTSGQQVRTQYLTVPDTGALRVLGSRPDWLWGLEHGVNERGVAIGNERVWTTRDDESARPALTGMDLVRLALERGRSADEALDVLTTLLERHGQGGPCDAGGTDSYFSSFLVVDGRGGWVLETVGRTWAARPVTGAAAISNRISLGTDWTRASADLVPGEDFDAFRDVVWSPIADERLACTVPAVTDPEGPSTPAALAALMRHHGTVPWGGPGERSTAFEPLPPAEAGPDDPVVTVCMHLRGYQATAASMICELPADAGADGAVVRSWVACGNPCVSVYLPLFGTGPVPEALGRADTWERFCELRRRVETPGEAGVVALGQVRAVLAPLEAELWQEADLLATDGAAADPTRVAAFVGAAWDRVDWALTTLGV